MSKGIDVPIARLNALFASYLWAGNSYTRYGRIDRVQQEDGKSIIPRAYDSASKKYIDVLLNGRGNLSFFDVQPKEKYEGGLFTAEVWICFAVNLETLYPSVVTERATEYAHDDALKVINKSAFKVTGLVRDYTAFNDYELVKTGDDMNQYHLFRFDTEVKYPTKC